MADLIADAIGARSETKSIAQRRIVLEIERSSLRPPVFCATADLMSYEPPLHLVRHKRCDSLRCELPRGECQDLQIATADQERFLGYEVR